MLTTEQSKKNLDSAKSKLESIRADLARKQAEYDSAEESHAKHVAATAGRQRYPKSLSVQRDALLRLKIEIEGLERAKVISEDAVVDAENRLQLAELYENAVKPYKQAELVYFEKAEDLISAVQELNAMTEKLCASVDSFLEQTGNPLAILRGLLSNPTMAGLSLRKFLDGEIQEANRGENGSFVDELATKYAQIARMIPELRNFEDSWATLSDHLDSTTRQANILVPMHVKHIPQAAPSKPESQVQRGQMVPRHARGGPDIDEKEDLRSPYWVRKRAAMRPVYEPTVLGKAKT